MRFKGDYERKEARRLAALMGSFLVSLLLVLMVLGACDPMTPPTKAELEADARKLFEEKVVVKDPGSNLCLVVLNGDFGKRPVFQTYIVRCKSEKHLLDPVSE
jgi:hypothetical protein